MRKRGFTLVEVLAATTLAALLMLVILRVISGLPRTQAAMDQLEKKQLVSSRLTSLLRFDLANAHLLHQSGGEKVELEGFGSLDATTTQPTHMPARITYAVERVGNESWLVRKQKLTSDNALTLEFVCQNVSAIQISKLAKREDPPSRPQFVEGEIPNIVDVTVSFGPESNHEEVITLR